MENVSSIISSVTSLPLDFAAGDKSAVQLLKESGYFESPQVITMEAVMGSLQENPDLIKAWISWSEDKRTTEGWFIVEEPEGFVVGYQPNGERYVFENKYMACADFIIREVASIGENAR